MLNDLVLLLSVLCRVVTTDLGTFMLFLACHHQPMKNSHKIEAVDAVTEN